MGCNLMLSHEDKGSGHHLKVVGAVLERTLVAIPKGLSEDQ